MLVRFKSTATESITMFGDVALELIKMLGASGAIPSAISADELPASAERLRQKLQSRVEPDSGDARDSEPPVALSTRAGPLLEIIERASAANVPIMWERAEGSIPFASSERAIW